jgi:hypothetical protein
LQEWHYGRREDGGALLLGYLPVLIDRFKFAVRRHFHFVKEVDSFVAVCVRKAGLAIDTHFCALLAFYFLQDTEPDVDCYKSFCESEAGKALCASGNVRNLMIDEPESLGPYAARYFASKMWYGENWFMQTVRKYSCNKQEDYEVDKQAYRLREIRVN